MIVMKIPAQWYVGTIGSAAGTPLARITPYGDDAASKTRMATIDEWTNSHHYGYKKIGSHVFTNSPVVGFKLTSSIRTAIHGGSDKWQVSDPRGFVCEITSSNLSDLLASSNVARGEILDPCVWARLGSANVLLNVTTPEYHEALKNTNISKSKINWSMAKPGNRIVLQNSLSGVYLGKLNAVERDYWDQNSTKDQNLLQFNKCNLHAILNESENYLYLTASQKVSAVDNTKALSIQECELLANEAREQNVEIRSHTHFGRLLGFYSTTKDAQDSPSMSLELEPTTVQSAPRSYQKVILCDYDEGFGEYVVFSNRKLIYELDKSQLAAGRYVVKTANVSMMGTTRYTQQQTEIDPARISAYYELYCTLTTPCGNILRLRV
jgi:hypothetical protein